MSKLVWDTVGERYYETGVKKGVLYKYDNTNHQYGTGVAWNGLSSISESPEGADETAIYADDIKYLSLRANEEFGGTIEAYTYPDEFAECDGTKFLATGIAVGQQARTMFGMSYVTTLGNDTAGVDYGYKIHIVYGATCSPSERSYSTINDSPEAITFSWEFSTVPVAVGDGFKPTALITIDSTKVDSTQLAALENSLYGTENTAPTLLLPEAIVSLFAGNPTYTYTAIDAPAAAANPMASGWYERTGGTGTSEDPYTYAKSVDTSVQNNKTYYTLVVTNPT